MRFIVYKKLLRSLSSTSISYNHHICRRFAYGLRKDGKSSKFGFISSPAFISLGYIVGSCTLCYHYTKESDKCENYITRMAFRTRMDPVFLPLDELKSISNLEYRRTRLTGTFLHDQEMYLSDCKLNSGSYLFKTFKIDSMFGKQPKIGYHVITPFKISKRNKIILIDRGWVDKAHLDPKTRLKGNPSQEVTFTGIIRKQKANKSSKPPNDLKHWPSRDIKAMAASIDKCLPILIDACHDSYVAGGPVPGQTMIDEDENLVHYQKMLYLSYFLVLFTTSVWLFIFGRSTFTKIKKIITGK